VLMQYRKRVIKKTIRISKTIEEEQKYVKKKFIENFEVIDMHARNCFPIGLVKPSTLKYCYGFNYYKV